MQFLKLANLRGKTHIAAFPQTEPDWASRMAKALCGKADIFREDVPPTQTSVVCRQCARRAVRANRQMPGVVQAVGISSGKP